MKIKKILIIVLLTLISILIVCLYPKFTIITTKQNIRQYEKINKNDYKINVKSILYNKDLPKKYYKLNLGKEYLKDNDKIEAIVFDKISIEKKIKIIPISNIKVINQKKIYENELLDISKIDIACIYEDNYQKILKTSEYIIENKEIPLKLGENEFILNYKNKKHSIFINANEKTNVSEAIRNNHVSEKDLFYKHISENIYITIELKHTKNNGTYYLTHVVINNPEQIKGGLSFDDFGGERELPSGNSKRNNWILGTNGSYFSYDTGEPTCANVFIKNNQILKDGITNGNEICLMKNGILFTPQKGITATELLEYGVKESWGTADPLLIQNGELQEIGEYINDEYYPRTAIGMVEPCEYYMITAGVAYYMNGISFEEMRTIFFDLNCNYARSLDGGGSSSLIFKHKLVNMPATVDERPVVDFLYFTE